MAEKNKNKVTLPFNLDLEKDFLSCLISAKPQDEIDLIISDLRETDFYDERTKTIFNACRVLIEEQNQAVIDTTLLIDQIKKTTNLDISSVLSDIISSSKSFIEIQTYKESLINYSYARRVNTSIRKLEEELWKIPKYNKILAIFESELNSLLGFRNLEDNLKHLSEATASFILQRTEAMKSDKRFVFPTGLKHLDSLLNDGFKPGQLAVVAARPGCGKTAFALNIVVNTINRFQKEEKRDKPVVAVFNQEMSREELVQRIIANHQKISLGKISSITSTDAYVKTSINMANEAFADTNIYIDDTPGIYPEEISAKCKKIKRKHSRIDLVIIDYLQLLTSKDKKQSRQYEVADISRSMKILAKELNAPVIVLSQLSRDIEKREDIKGVSKQPKLSDLRDSGAIEQDADIVIFLHNKKNKEQEENQEVQTLGPKEIVLTLAKNRNGTQGIINLLFAGQFMKFVEKAKDTEENKEDIKIDAKKEIEKIQSEKEKINKEIRNVSQEEVVNQITGFLKEQEEKNRFSDLIYDTIEDTNEEN